VDALPALSAATEYESFGVEDPRITQLDGTYWITYTAVSHYGIGTGLASTTDFKTFERHGIIFPPPNRNVTIFPGEDRRPLRRAAQAHAGGSGTAFDLDRNVL